MDMIREFFKKKFNVQIPNYEMTFMEDLISKDSFFSAKKDLIFTKSEKGIVINYNKSSEILLLDIILVFTLDPLDGFSELTLWNKNEKISFPLSWEEINNENIKIQEVIEKLMKFIQNENEIVWIIDEYKREVFMKYIIYEISDEHSDLFFFFEEKKRRIKIK